VLVLLQLVGLLFLFPLIVFVPGFLALRRFMLPDELRLIVSISVSLLLIGAAAFLFYVAGAGPFAYKCTTVAVVVAAFLSRRTLRAFLRAPAVRTHLVYYTIFLAWLLALCVVTRNFSGDGWAGDWEEHFQRALLFCGKERLDAQLIGGWALTARPPLYNLAAAFFMQNVGYSFTVYQLASVLLSSLVFFGAAALAYALARKVDPRPGRTLLLLTLLLGLNPSVVQNATYPWTRALTNFFVLTGLALFWMAVADGSPSLRRWAYLHLGLAALTHYSAGPYVTGLLFMEAGLLTTRRLRVREVWTGPILLVAPLVPWLLFAVYHFGISGTFLSNSTAIDTASLGFGGNIAKVIGNLASTFVPHPLRRVPMLYEQGDVADHVRDYAFLIYQVNLPFMVGSVGCVVVLWLALKDTMRSTVTPAAAVWTFIFVTMFVGIATVGEADRFGVGHVCLQPLAIAGLVYLAVRWTQLSRGLRAALTLGTIADAALGVFLHLWMRHLELADLFPPGSAARAVSENFVSNLQRKADLELVLLGDVPLQGMALVALLSLALVRLWHPSCSNSSGNRRIHG
jgi:hypothetical protein